MSSTNQLTPSYYGFIDTTYDALVLFEACLRGQISYIGRRPSDGEQKDLIMSGNIFIYKVLSSSIKRWTDGIKWSPSRRLDNFLIYRQLQRSFQLTEQRKALKKNDTSSCIRKNTTTNARTNTRLKNGVPQMFKDGSGIGIERSLDRLVGSLTGSYNFMEMGLVKRTIKVIVGDTTYHLVSYYTISDAENCSGFMVPSKDSQFKHIKVRGDLLTNKTLQNPIDPPLVEGPATDIQNTAYGGVTSLPTLEASGGFQHNVGCHKHTYQLPASHSFESNSLVFNTTGAYVNSHHYPQSRAYLNHAAAAYWPDYDGIAIWSRYNEQ
jgi:hypothetical protein